MFIISLYALKTLLRNVRELENVLQRALVLHENGCITKTDILTDILSNTIQSRVSQDARLSEVG